jgi:hypothetical protein
MNTCYLCVNNKFSNGVCRDCLIRIGEHTNRVLDLLDTPIEDKPSEVSLREIEEMCIYCTYKKFGNKAVCRECFLRQEEHDMMHIPEQNKFHLSNDQLMTEVK